MKPVNRKILEQVIAATAEPLLIVRIDHPDWPVILTNPAFDRLRGTDAARQPFADIAEQLCGRELALEVSETLRAKEEMSFPVETGGREYLLALKPLQLGTEAVPRFYAAFWRGGAAAGSEMHEELLKAKRRIRDLAREDPVTGLLKQHAFHEVLEHDWAVARRERSALALVLFKLDDFSAYVDVFGSHASDSCLRRVGQAVRRSLRRASDVVARLDGGEIVVLVHAPDEGPVREFAGAVATTVYELGIHHPRSRVSRFVTVTFDVAVSTSASDDTSARAFLRDLLQRPAD